MNRQLNPGTRLGPYEIVAPIGAGGMGEVYKGRDTRLDRTVAIKILPTAVAEDPELRRRFEREGRAISQLSHPHICTLYDVGHHAGVEYMVMEHLEGETMASRLSRGRLRLDRALAIARDMLEALDSAHSRGITHRDLKPANVMLTRTGAKLLDFGLAKLRNPGVEITRLLDSGVAHGGLTSSADEEALTREHPLTGARTIIGTLHYMAPEQIEGREADARADIFAFGAVLYEMVTGRRAFQGSSQAGLIGAILMSDPPPVRTIDASLPAAVESLVARCLAKDADHRWQSARDLLWHLDALDASTANGRPAGRRAVRHVVWIAAAAVLAAASAGFVAGSWRTAEPRSAVHAHLDVPGRLSPEYYPAIAVSPDGASIVFRVGPPGTTVLMMRRVDAASAQPVAGSENAHTPFFSPDGKWLAFLAGGKVMKLLVGGSTPMVVATAPSLSPGSPGAAWGPDDSIVFAAGTNGLLRVPAAGGAPEPLTSRDESRGETTHHSPQFLPGGRELLFTVKSVDGESHAAILSLETREWQWIDRLEALSGAVRYVETGHLVYPEAGTGGHLRVVPFDLATRTVVASPILLPEAVYAQASSDVMMAQFAISEAGVLAYVTGRPPAWSLVRAHLDGTIAPIVAEPHTYRYPRVSQDGSRVAISIAEDRSDIYIVNVERGTLRRITSQGSNTQPVWTHDGARIVFTSIRPGAQAYDLYDQSTDVGFDAEPTSLLRRPDGQFPSDWSPVAPRLAFYELGNDTARDVWVLSADTGQAVKVLGTPASERAAVFSPDGRWLSYVSDESGRDEVYIQRYPGPGGLEQISTGGGTEPVWAPLGNELYYRHEQDLVAVTIDLERGRALGAVRRVLSGPFERAPSDIGRANYDVFPDGRSFVFVQSESANPDWHVHVILNWFEELRQPAARR